MYGIYFLKKKLLRSILAIELFLIPFILILTLGCSSLNSKSEFFQNSNEMEPLAQAEKIYNEGRFEEAKKQFSDFQMKFPQSQFLLSARLGEGQSLEMLGRFDESIEIYQNVYDRSLSVNGKIAALSQYRQSFCYEKKGDDFKALTLLLDLKPREDFLPVEISSVQIPGRLALLYSKLGQITESSRYQLMTAKNLELMKSQISPNKLAESYFLIGSLNTLQAKEDSFEVYLRGLKISSYYLISSIELNQDEWSTKSVELLKYQIKDLWKAIHFQSHQSTERQRYERQIQMTNGLIEALNSINLRRPLNFTESSSQQKNLFEFVSKIEKEATHFLVNGPPRLRLTRDGEKSLPVKKKNKKR